MIFIFRDFLEISLLLCSTRMFFYHVLHVCSSTMVHFVSVVSCWRDTVGAGVGLASLICARRRRGSADPPVTDDVSLRTCQLSDYREMCPYLRHKLTSRARDSLHSFIFGINNKGCSLMNCPLAAYFLLSNYSNQIKYWWLSCITEICRARRVPRRMA